MSRVSLRWWWPVISAAVVLSCWLLVFYWQQIWPNLAASLIWALPAFTAQHIALRRHVDRRHEETQQHLAAQDEAIGATRADS